MCLENLNMCFERERERESCVCVCMHILGNGTNYMNSCLITYLQLVSTE
jgi:hypothetical protein